MSHPVAVPLRRCCPAHRDWASLARHLITELDDVPIRTVLAELQQAQSAAKFFGLDLADALDCAELMVRYRVMVATAPGPPPALALSADRYSAYRP